MPKKTGSRRKKRGLRSHASAPAGTAKAKAGVDESAVSAAEGKLAEYRRKRDFARTGEPRGGKGRAGPRLAFVIQKHAASHLHYDLRLELDGVMKSWAVPKGPSLDPSVKRLAMEVEDHPIEYNTFEGTIPKGEYGGGTVMLWDRGTYAYGGTDADPLEGLRRGFKKGDFKFILRGKRLRGSWVLVRTRRDAKNRAQWLLIKHRDEFAVPGSEVTAEFQTSVASGRSMDEIAEGRSKVWYTNRTPSKRATTEVETADESPRDKRERLSAYQRLMARRMA